MRKDKNHALRLRREGKSYNEISEILNIPKSTLSYWLKDVDLSPIHKELLWKKSRDAGLSALIRRNKLQTLEAKIRSESIRKIESISIKNLNQNALRLIGTALYMGEGGKSQSRVDFTNSNPEVVKIIMKFFRIVCNAKEDKFRVQLALHDYHMEQRAIEYWSDITKISPNQFLKINYIVSKYSHKLRKNKLPFGTIQIRICDVKLFHKIMGWIQGIYLQIDKMPG